MFNLAAAAGSPGGYVLGTARVVIDDRFGHRVTECPVIEVKSGRARRFLLKVWRFFLRKLHLYGAMIAMATFLSTHNTHVGPEHIPYIMGAISSAVATTWKVEIGKAIHDHTASTGDTFKTALYTSSATLGASTTSYSATNEISGTGYTAGGVTTASTTPVPSGTTSIFSLANAAWTGASFTANGSQTYNSTKSNRTWFIIAFGSDQTVTAGNFTIQWPTADASNAIVRIT